MDVLKSFGLSLGLLTLLPAFCQAECPQCQPYQRCPQITYGYHSVHRFGYECRANCEIRIPVCIDSTCDMYPHYAYYPENHGHYYFQPYNWEHYSRDMAFLLGVGHVAPYSEEGLHELKPTTVPEQPLIHVRREKLPNLEDLLKPQSPEFPTPATPPAPKLD